MPIGIKIPKITDQKLLDDIDKEFMKIDGIIK